MSEFLRNIVCSALLNEPWERIQRAMTHQRIIEAFLPIKEGTVTVLQCYSVTGSEPQFAFHRIKLTPRKKNVTVPSKLLVVT